MSKRYHVVVMVVICLVSLMGSVVRADTVTFWEFNEATSGYASTATNAILDSSGNGHHGTVTIGDPTYTTGASGNAGDGAMHFTNDAVSINDDSAFDMLLADGWSYEIEADINVGTGGKYYVIFSNHASGRTVDTDTLGYVFRLDTTGTYLQLYTAGTPGNWFRADSSIAVNDSEWHNVKLVVDTDADGALDITYFIDGVENAAVMSGASPWTVENIVPCEDIEKLIGHPQPAGENMQGSIDNLKFSSFAVPEPSTLAMLASGLIGLLAYAWRKRK